MYLKFIYLLLFVLLLSACQTEEEKRQAHLEELLSCKPETPLSKGELYERAMQDYWKYRMEWVWEADKYLIEKQEEEYSGLGWLAPSVDKKIATKKCGLTWTWLGKPDKITKDTCYPRKITQYHTVEDSIYSYKHPEKTIEEFLKNRGAKSYRLERDPPLYRAEFYNKDTDFTVVHAMPASYDFYPKDCCTLMTIQGIKAFRDEYREQWKEGIWVHGWRKDMIKKHIDNSYLFLVVKYFYGSTEKRGYSIDYYYYPISHCGKLITY